MTIDQMIDELNVAKEIYGGSVEVVYETDNGFCERICDCPAVRSVQVIDSDLVCRVDDDDANTVQMLVFR
jgi:hypothetical protein